MSRNFAAFALAAACGASAVGWTSHALAQTTASTTGLSSRRTTAITYEARRTTKVDLVGTPLMPRSRGEVEIQTESAGPVRIKAKMRDLTSPGQFGPEYLTFVLWAIPPQGRSKNLGEVRLDDGQNEIEATSDVQTFALIVTAEPYYAVTTPSEVVVMENLARQDTKGRTSVATLSYEIVPRGAYLAGGSLSPTPADGKQPPDVQQARNAVAIAQLAQADTYVPDSLDTARRLLIETEQLVKRKESKREIISHARTTVQAAEEARLRAVEARTAAEAKAERAAIEAGRATAEQERQRAERAAAESAQLKQRAELAAQQAAQEQQKAEDARREAEAARLEAERARGDAQQQAARAETLRAKAESDKAALRTTLLHQFNDILDTRDTARGLIVNVGDVLFETGRYELRPEAREKLARFAGIALAHPGLNIQTEGFTDSTGTDALNERLSQQRADAVGEYLISQGLPRDRVATRGYGASYPVASNDTREGRQQNRRVELVVSGEVIGTPISDARQ